MITFRKLKYSDVPEVIAKRVISYSDKEVVIDDAGITKPQLQKLIDFMLQEGYKEI